MYIPSRRLVLFGGTTSLLFGCAGGQTIGGVPIPMVKAYADDLADALSAGADIYLNSTTPPVPTESQKAAVARAKADIQSAKTALDSVLVPTTTTVPLSARDTVKLIILDAEKLQPFVAPLLGTAGVYIPLALSVLQAFVDSLPPPPTTPPTPPAPLAEKAKSFRRGVR